MIPLILIFTTLTSLLATLIEESSKYFKLFILSCILLITSFVIQHNTIEYKDTHRKILLENLKDNTYISGHISLLLGSGEGEVKQEYEYTMYYKTKYGAKLLRLPVSKTDIIYSNGTPYLEIVTTSIKWHDNWKDWFCIGTLDEVRYNIYVPRNTIDGEFKLDAQ